MDSCISSYFSNIANPRIDRKKLHSLSDILILTICAMLSGADDYEAIEEFGQNKKHWLKSFLPFKEWYPIARLYSLRINQITPPNNCSQPLLHG